ncbi:integrase, catalytic region, zinc finger, CCHC-type containing protein [Tanacetum coccineum]
MHNNIMAAGSRDRPPMLATGRYAQWRSRFLRYIDTRPNGDALRKCILTGPYTPTMVTTPAVPATENSPEIPEKTSVETVLNMTPENKAHYESEKEAIHLILTGIGDEIYSTVDACQTLKRMGKPIERRTKICRRILALICKELHELYKLPTTTSELPQTQEHECDTTPRYKNDNQTGQFGNQRTINVVGARETVGGPVVQQSGIQCFNCKEFGHYAKECRKPKRVRDSTYHTKKMLLENKLRKGSLQAEQSDWQADTDDEYDEQDDTTTLKHNVFLPMTYTILSNLNPLLTHVETGDSNVIPDSPDMCDNDIQNDQNDVECDDRAVATCLI